MQASTVLQKIRRSVPQPLTNVMPVASLNSLCQVQFQYGIPVSGSPTISVGFFSSSLLGE